MVQEHNHFTIQLSELTDKVSRIERFLMAKDSTQRDEKDAFLTLEELCDYLPSKPSKSSIYGKASKREIPHKKVNGRLLFKRSEIDQWVDEHSRKSVDDRVDNLFIKRGRNKR